MRNSVESSDNRDRNGTQNADNMGRDVLETTEYSSELKTATRILDSDARPSFVVDSSALVASQLKDLRVVYRNPAIVSRPSLEHGLLHDGGNATQHAKLLTFYEWMKQQSRKRSTPPKIDTYLFQGFIWTTILLQDLLIVSGLPRENVDGSPNDRNIVQDNLSRAVDHDMFHISSISSQTETGHASHAGAGDSSECRGQQQLGVMSRMPRSPHIQYLYSIDWASTDLGPMSTWSDELYQMCAFAMSDSEPVMLYWGDSLVVIHNEAAVKFFPQVRESYMGSTVEKTFPQIWASFAPVFTTVRTTMQVVSMEEVPVLLDRTGKLLESYTSYRFVPVADKYGHCLGLYETMKEVTAEVLARRRLATLLEVSSCSTDVVGKQVFWSRLISALSSNKQDIGFALLYSLQNSPGDESDYLKRGSHRVCVLEGTLGISEDHISVKDRLDIDRERAGYIPGLRRALENNDVMLLQLEDGSLPSEYVAGVKCRGFSAPCEKVLICPIRPTDGARAVGFLIMGLSPRVAYDEDFKQFVDILNRQIATSMASIALFNDELSRERERAEEAALVHANLQERLKQKTQALLTSEAKFERMTDSAPIGISITDGTGKITYANEAWYKITGHTGIENSAESWIAFLHEDDVQLAVASFAELMSTKQDKSFEIRLKKEWTKEVEGAEPIRTATWVLASAYVVEEDENGQATSIFGALTDISAQKWAEETHRRRMEEALTLKSQQESFIDTISHEMRNPLSAILQSVDEIADHLSQSQSTPSIDLDSTRSSIEAVETIMLCCQHQRRVIDDVLTLSKMNTDMLVITVDEADPVEVVQSVVKMFSGDAKKQGIALKMEVEGSIQQMGVTRLMLDPSRLSQVLVNLLGNAIKFTRDSSERRIKVSVGTFACRPTSGDFGVEYVERQPSKGISLDDIDTDERVYLRIVVQDTGVGMTDDEKKRLFKRFSQASPRTYVQYGGSGLGLFISKKLTELQGGAIGLQMGDRKGTTFAFYVSALRSKEKDTAVSTVNTTGLDPDMPVQIHTDPPIPLAVAIPPRLNLSRAIMHTLLVVEDNLINQRVMCQQLQKKGFIVYAANHGAEALEFLENTKFRKGKEETGKTLSMILLDIEMPVMDGLTCVRKIRQLEAEGTLTAHVPVISVSANARSEQVREAKLAGMDENIPKPFRVADLTPIIHSLLERSAVP